MSDLSEKVREFIRSELDKLQLGQCRWEDDEDIMLLNGSPIGCTITKRSKEVDRWWPSLKTELTNIIGTAILTHPDSPIRKLIEVDEKIQYYNITHIISETGLLELLDEQEQALADLEVKK